ncbi:MAG: hypothetical protein NC914_00105 [Candidatus Omnitrophica bacterium]|nr:hypothetical protein [Candidatus Omnitrophota bacterium]
MHNKRNLLLEIAKIGRKFNPQLPLNQIQPFRHFCDKEGVLIEKDLDLLDGAWSRREIISRYLLLSSVLDQGPDMEGVRKMVVEVINNLYKQEIRIFHRPLDFFKEVGIAIDSILSSHDSVKKIRSYLWAKENKSNPDKYNLFMDNSKQVLNYAIFRWGVPLALPLLLEKDGNNLINFIESWSSGEVMSRQLKDHNRYGLGKAIGDKAAHLFVKWYINTFKLVMTKKDCWGRLSFELPLDSNAGRVLFRTGWLLQFSTIRLLEKWKVINKGQGKGGKHHIRVTNLRGNKSEAALKDKKLFNDYEIICRDYLKTKTNPRSIEIQQIPNVLLMHSEYGIGDLDDGLMYIGTNVCINLENPKCSKCPISKFCEGYNTKSGLIKDYRT